MSISLSNSSASLTLFNRKGKQVSQKTVAVS